MAFHDFTKKDVQELERMLEEEKQRLYELRLKISVNQLKQVRDVRKTRTMIAQLLTAIGQKKNSSAKK